MKKKTTAKKVTKPEVATIAKPVNPEAATLTVTLTPTSEVDAKAVSEIMVAAVTAVVTELEKRQPGTAKQIQETLRHQGSSITASADAMA